MTQDPPKYRPLERFWPYADLPEQPTDEELASLDPDLHEALFGPTSVPFSITLVFPTLDLPEFARALDLARGAAEFRETGSGGSHHTQQIHFKGESAIGKGDGKGEPSAPPPVGRRSACVASRPR